MKQSSTGTIEIVGTELSVTGADGRLTAFDRPYTGSSGLGEERLKAVMENYVRYYAIGQGHTARAKRYDLMYFLEFLAGSPSRVEQVIVSDWTFQRTQDFVDRRLSSGEAPATVSRRLATIKHFGRTLAERFHGYINPAREVKSPVLQPSRPHGLNPDEVRLLRQVALDICEREGKDFIRIRNRFLLELLLATGLRADEVRLLVMSQISDDLCWLKNVKTKGRKFRNVYLDSDIRDELKSYLSARQEALQEKFPEIASLSASELNKLPVLISLHRVRLGEPGTFGLAPKTIWRIVAEFGSRAAALSEDTGGNLHPHRLRHTFAHGLLDSSKDIRLVAQALGHSDVRTTMRYTERTEEEVARAIERKLHQGKQDDSDALTPRRR